MLILEDSETAGERQLSWRLRLNDIMKVEEDNGILCDAIGHGESRQPHKSMIPEFKLGAKAQLIVDRAGDMSNG
jgi:hypothetical protein